MADQRPVPKRRSVHLGATRNDDYSTTDLYGTSQDVKTNTRAPEVSGAGLPTCVQQKNNEISSDQKFRDSNLPRLLYQLDEACNKSSNDAEKSRLANSCVQAASSPKRKYRLLNYFELLDNNKNDIVRVAGALSILEKYSMNLLRDEKPPQWKEIKFSTSIIHNMVFPVIGAVDVLKQMGYTEQAENTIMFPDDVDQPNIQTVVVLTADLSIARHETDALMKKVHPFLIFDPTGFSAGNSEESMTGGGFCAVCSEQNLAKNCDQCDMQFCLECDERWHGHKLRRNHVRTRLVEQTLSERKPRRPVPVPRQRRGQKTEDGNLRNSQNFQDSSAGRRSSSGNSAASNSPYSPSSDQEIRRPPSRTGSSRDNTTSPGNMNIHVNPSQSYGNPMYGEYAPQGLYSGSEKRAQGFYQSGNSAQDFHQSRDSTQRQAQKKALHRVLSCPDCASLYDEGEGKCPSCSKAAAGKSAAVRFSPNQHALNPAATKLPRSGVPNSEQNRTLKELASVKKLVGRPLPDPPRGQGVVARDNEMDVDHDVYEDVDNLLEWNCEHCTFANPPSTKVCQACYKTPSDLKNKPKLVQKSSPPTTASNCPAPKPSGTQGALKTPEDYGPIYMTPKNRPLDGGIYRASHEGSTPPLPVKKSGSDEDSPRGIIVDAQKNREQQLSEKERGKMFDEEKQELWRKGLITHEEIYNIQSREVLNETLAARKRMTQGYSASGHTGQAGYSGYSGHAGYSTSSYPVPPAYSASGYPGQPGYSAAKPGEGLDPQQLQQLLEAGVISEQDIINDQKAQKDFGKDRQVRSDVHKRNETSDNSEDLSLSEEQLQRLLSGGGFVDDRNAASSQPFTHGNLPSQSPQQFTSARPTMGQPNQANIGNQLSQPFVQSNPGSALTKEEREALYEAGIPRDPTYDIPTHGHAPASQDDIQQMLAEFHKINQPGAGERPQFDKKFTYYHYNVSQETPVVHGIYDKLPSTMYASMPAKSSKDNFSSYLNSQKPLDNLTRRNLIDDQSKLYVKWLKEAEQLGFTVEELNLANHLNWQDQQRRNPVQWLKDEWSDRVAEVIGRVTQKTSNENDRIGNLSTGEAKEALLENNGSVESACKACIESRREKLAKMSESSFFTRADCLNALDRNEGDLEEAMLELEVKALEPIRKRVLGLRDLEDSGRHSGRFDNTYEEVVKNQNVSFERRVRIVFAERKMTSWGRAETAVKLLEMGYHLEDCIEAASAFGYMDRALRYLQQECPICYDEKPMGQMITFLSCQDVICKDCVKDHLTHCIKEMQIHRIVCPVCGLPDLRDEAEAALYFNNLDILIRTLVDPETHDLFQKKLRDRALRKEENFRWCSHCSYGFINDNPNVNKMQCPGCQNFTCFSCKKPWEDQHEGITCEQFARWKEENDEEYQIAGLAGHLARNGISCPECRFRYDLARGGCMHFKCGQCGHEFCSGCNNAFKRDAECGFSQNCARKGMHAHHPRDCLFYLRDWNTETLQQLLRDNNVNYQAGARGLPVQDDEELVGAVGGAVQNCGVMLQIEAGMEDVKCGLPCNPDHDGLCEKHYKEYLVDLINKNGVDPAEAMEIDEMHIVFRRAEIPAPLRGMDSDDGYRQRLLEALKQQIPLPRPPEIEADAEVELEEVEE